MKFKRTQSDILQDLFCSESQECRPLLTYAYRRARVRALSVPTQVRCGLLTVPRFLSLQNGGHATPCPALPTGGQVKPKQGNHMARLEKTHMLGDSGSIVMTADVLCRPS